MFSAREVRRLITCLQDRDEEDKVKVMDAAYWMKGCSSLGRLRYAVLVGIGKKKHKNEKYCLVDIKEAVQAVAPHSSDARMPRDNAQRVVEGARKISPYLGQRILPWRFCNRSVVMRELLQQDLSNRPRTTSHLWRDRVIPFWQEAFLPDGEL